MHTCTCNCTFTCNYTLHLPQAHGLEVEAAVRAIYSGELGEQDTELLERHGWIGDRQPRGAEVGRGKRAKLNQCEVITADENTNMKNEQPKEKEYVGENDDIDGKVKVEDYVATASYPEGSNNM